ncbi:hypothetical protein IU449_04490 [Nocardia higoensis]|uniref:Uncharacterized protein n=1 Tax=Nocardia higoensis TaxID=228599 RepID=A0ABS0D5Q7_9NOCA|nr:hypothetical protein [Nocardia higoensis]MBF6353815.1 hypothetical protein [Nocardia higoensis]
MIGFIMAPLYAALLFVFFLFLTHRKVKRRYLRRARSDPRDLVPTVGSVLGDVVGRNQ